MLDVGDQGRVEADKALSPAGPIRIFGGVLVNFAGELSGELVALGQVVLPGGVVEQIGGDAGQPGQR